MGALLVLTGFFYLRPEILLGTGALFGADYIQLHIRRIRFARDALFGARHVLPGWYPHEVLGAPFAANLPNFPWIPTGSPEWARQPRVGRSRGPDILPRA